MGLLNINAERSVLQSYIKYCRARSLQFQPAAFSSPHHLRTPHIFASRTAKYLGATSPLTSFRTHYRVSKMERADSMTNHYRLGQDTAVPWSSFRAGSSSSSARLDESMPASSPEIVVNTHIPVFLDRTFRMVEEVPDAVVCWSTAGDSFIVKQVRARVTRRCARFSGGKIRLPWLDLSLDYSATFVVHAYCSALGTTNMMTRALQRMT